jgi:hypothetical protein
VNLALIRIDPKRFIIYIKVYCSVLLKAGNMYRSKNFWRFRVAAVFTANQKSLFFCIVEKHIADRSVKRAVFVFESDVFVRLQKNCNFSTYFIKVFNFGFLENSFSWCRADIFGQRERERYRERERNGNRQKDSTAKPKGDFLEYARALRTYK